MTGQQLHREWQAAVKKHSETNLQTITWPRLTEAERKAWKAIALKVR